MDQLFGPAGYVDAFHEVRLEDLHLVVWQARANNVGWRID